MHLYASRPSAGVAGVRVGDGANGVTQPLSRCDTNLSQNDTRIQLISTHFLAGRSQLIIWILPAEQTLTNRTPMCQKTYELSEKQHMIFRKKNLSTQNPKHIRPTYTVQLYTRPGLINQLNFQKKNIALSKSKHMAHLYNAVVYAAYKQIIKFPHTQCGCISGFFTSII